MTTPGSHGKFTRIISCMNFEDGWQRMIVILTCFELASLVSVVQSKQHKTYDLSLREMVQTESDISTKDPSSGR